MSTTTAPGPTVLDALSLAAEAADGSLVLPGGVSISRSLVESWYGAPLPGRW